MGTLDDYMGRTYEMKNPDYQGFILQLHKDDSLMIRRIEYIVDEKFVRNKKDYACSNCHDFSTLKSRNLEKNINKFYSFKKINNSKNGNFHNHNGKLKCEKILSKNENDRLSYFAGVSLVSGKIEDKKFIFSESNSKNKIDCTEKVILSLGGKILKTYNNSPRTPVTFSIEFLPTDKMKEIFYLETK